MNSLVNSLIKSLLNSLLNSVVNSLLKSLLFSQDEKGTLDTQEGKGTLEPAGRKRNAGSSVTFRAREICSRIRPFRDRSGETRPRRAATPVRTETLLVTLLEPYS